MNFNEIRKGLWLNTGGLFVVDPFQLLIRVIQYFPDGELMPLILLFLLLEWRTIKGWKSLTWNDRLANLWPFAISIGVRVFTRWDPIWILIGSIALTALLPRLMVIPWSRATRSWHYLAAFVASSVARILNPFAVSASRSAFYLSRWYQLSGKVDAAVAFAASRMNAHTAFGQALAEDYFALSEDWSGAITWLEATRNAAHNQLDHHLLEIHALGELGKHKEMLQTLELHSKALIQDPEYWRIALLYACTFTGQHNQAERLLETARGWGRFTIAIWRAKALKQAGLADRGVEALATEPESKLAQNRMWAQRVATAAVHVVDEASMLRARTLANDVDSLIPRLHAIAAKRGRQAFPIATIAIVSTNIIVFAWLWTKTNGDPDLPLLRNAGGFVVSAVLDSREWWRLAAHVFLHLSWFHLAVNMLALVWFLGEFEQQFGNWPATAAFFAAVILSALIMLFLAATYTGDLIFGVFDFGLPEDMRNTVAVGASGVVMAIVTMRATLGSWAAMSSSQVGLPTGNVLLASTIVIGQFLLDYFASPPLSTVGHGAGVVAGLILAIPVCIGAEVHARRSQSTMRSVL